MVNKLLFASNLQGCTVPYGIFLRTYFPETFGNLSIMNLKTKKKGGSKTNLIKINVSDKLSQLIKREMTK